MRCAPSASATTRDPEALGEQVAERLIADGAGAILDAVREYDGPLPTHD